MKEAVEYLFLNRYDEANKTLEAGFKKNDGSFSAQNPDLEFDLRPVYALFSGITALVMGIGTFETDQFEKCIERSWEAVKLIDEAPDKEWPGYVVVQCVCHTIVGVCQLLQHKFVRGGINVVKALLWTPRLRRECLTYEHPVIGEDVRSTAQIFLGVINLVASFLPPELLGLAKNSLNIGSRSEALDSLSQSALGQGWLAPLGALVYAGFHLDVQFFLGMKLDDQVDTTASELVAQYLEKFPNSLTFSILQSCICLLDGRTEEATELTGGLVALELELPMAHVVCLLAHTKSLACQGSFVEVEGLIWECINRWNGVNRRSGVPIMQVCTIYYLAIGYLLDESFSLSASEVRQKIEHNLKALIEFNDKHSNKSDWRPEDKWALYKARKYLEDPDQSLVSFVVDFFDFLKLKLHGLSVFTRPRNARCRELLIDILKLNELEAEHPTKLKFREYSMNQQAPAPNNIVRLQYYTSELYRLEGNFELARMHLQLADDTLKSLTTSKKRLFFSKDESFFEKKCRLDSCYPLIIHSKILLKLSVDPEADIGEDLKNLSKAPAGFFSLMIKLMIAEANRFSQRRNADA